MLPYFVFDHINIGPVQLYTWGFFVGLAFSAGYLLTLWQAKKKKISLEKITGLALVIFLGALVGSRVLFLLQDPQRWLADVSLLWRIEQGGLMLWGGILGAILFGWLYVRWAKLGFWRMADLVTPAIAIGIGIGRIGCFLINDHMGASTSLPWGILWPDGIARHPVALYESLAGFGLFFVFWWLQRRAGSRRHGRLEAAVPPTTSTNVIPAKAGIQESGSWLFGRDDRNHGYLFLAFLISYAVIRFFLDFLRASDGLFADPRWWALTSSQWISMAALLGIFLIFVKNYKKEKG